MITHLPQTKVPDYVNREYILSIPKYINDNGCWIPTKKSSDGRYVRIRIEYQRYSLHRLSMCIFYGVEYWNSKIDTRHSKSCDTRCFNPEHLKPGSMSDNQQDSVRDKTHWQAKKDVCPKCGGEYKEIRILHGPRKGDIFRRCTTCYNEYQREWRNK